MRKINNLETIWAELVIIGAVLISLIPTFYYVNIAWSNTIFPLIHNNHPDYYFYLSLMRQGFEGKWLVTSRFTPENFPPQFVQTFFVILGHLSKITSIDLPQSYTLARLFLGLAVGLSIYFLICLVDQRKVVRLTGLVFAMFGSGFWIIKNGQIQQFMSFWTAFDASERTTYLPHHLLATLAIVLSLVFLTLYSRTNKQKFIYFACLTGIIGVLANPISFINLFSALLLSIAFLILLNLDRKKNIKSLITIIFLYLNVCAFPFLYLLFIRQTAFPWTNYNPAYGMLVSYPLTFKEYILALGPTLIFSLFGIKTLLLKKDFISLALFSWFLVPFIGIFIVSKLFNTGNAYFFNAAHYIPVGIIGALGFANFVDFLAKKLGHKINVIFFPLLLLLLIYFSVSWYGSLKKEIFRWSPDSYNIFLPRDFITAFNFLEIHSNPESVVLTGGFLGNLIPAFTHNRSLSGHIVNTYDFNTKNSEIAAFFNQNDADFAKNLIKKYHISYIFYSYDTPPAAPVFVDAVGLKQIYQNPAVTIFTTHQ